MTDMTIIEAQNKLESGETTAVALADEVLRAIDAHEANVHAYLEVFDDVAEQAKVADARRASGERGPLLGIPIAVKDNMLIEGRRVSAGSKMLENYTAAYDAHVITRLKEAGAVLVGRTNMDEFAMGSSTEHSAFQQTTNPVDENRVPGGSSGGSAAAVAYGGALAALGSDTGGSIRQPASFCGVVGLKPTYGTISRRGLIAMGSSLDQIGPVAQTVDDVAALFMAIRGTDEKDSTSLRDPAYAPAPEKIRIGIPEDFLKDGIDADVLAAFRRAVEFLEKDGVAVEPVALPSVERALAMYYIIMPAEASANLARFDGVRYGLHVPADDLEGEYRETRTAGFGAEVKRRIMIGTYALSTGYADAYYGRATALREQLREEFAAAFDSVDAVITPTAPTPAFKLGEKSDPLSMYLSDIFTVPANLTGMPALSVPAGTVTRDGVELPVGIQFMAPHLHEETLFALGRLIERYGIA